MNMEKNALVKYTFLKLLLREFGIYVRETEVEKADLAKQCVEIYDTPEEFYEKTNWDKDNPEQFPVFGGESNLPENPGENLVFFPYPVGRRFKKVEKLKSDCKNKKLR